MNAAAERMPDTQTKQETRKKKRPPAEIVSIGGAPAQTELRMHIETRGDAETELRRMPMLEGVRTVKDAACRLLVAVNFEADPADGWKVGFSFNSIILRIRELFPQAKTCHNSLRWYLMRVRCEEEEGFKKYRLQTRFKRPKSKSNTI